MMKNLLAPREKEYYRLRNIFLRAVLAMIVTLAIIFLLVH